MQSKALSVEQYLAELPPERQGAMTRLRELFRKKLPKGFEEAMSYGMIGYVVPHKLYPGGYHVDPQLPLPFLNLASQKQAISVYHLGLHADPALLAWFSAEHARATPRRLDMGKSCIRYKKADDIPFALLEQLAGRTTPKDWIALYEARVKPAAR
jgi:hypothetical protein